MTVEFQRKKLIEVCKLINGRAYSKPELLAEGKYPVLRVGNFFTNDHWYYSDLELDEDKYCDKGDLLYAWSASFGPRIWHAEKVIYHYHIWKVVPDLTLIDKKFLFYFFEWDADQIKNDQGAGTTMIHVSKGSMENREINLPQLKDQARIISLLDEAFADIATAKANAEKNLLNARELANELSAQILSAPSANCTIQSLEEIVEADCSLSYGIVQPGDEFESGLPIVRPVNLDRPLIELGGLKRIDPTLAKGYERTKLKGGEVLLCVRGTTGTLSCASSALAGANVTRGIVPIRFNPQSVSQELGYFLMRSAPVQAQIRAKTYGTALMQINIRDLRQIQIPVPHPSQQAAIAKALQDAEEQTNRLTEIQGQKLTALEDLKKSLLHQAFSGQLSQ